MLRVYTIHTLPCLIDTCLHCDFIQDPLAVLALQSVESPPKVLCLGLILFLLVAARELLPFVHRLQHDLAQVVVDVRRRIPNVVPILVVERVRAPLLRLRMPTGIFDVREPKLVRVFVDTPERMVDVDVIDRRVAVRL